MHNLAAFLPQNISLSILSERRSLAGDWPWQTELGIYMYNVETIQQNVKAIATAYADYAKTSFEQGKTYVEQLAQVKSLDKAVELHTQYAKMAYETFVAEANKISDLYKEFTKEAFAPLAASFGTK